MALTESQEQLEHDLKVEQMRTTIDAARINMDKMRADMKWESRKFALQLAVGLTAAVGAGIALANWLRPAPDSSIQAVRSYELAMTLAAAQAASERLTATLTDKQRQILSGLSDDQLAALVAAVTKLQPAAPKPESPPRP